MNPEQAKKIARWLGSGAGGFLVGWAVSRGFQYGDLVNQILSSELFIGLATSTIIGVWSYLSGRMPALVAVVDALAKQPDSPVKGVVMEPTAEGAAIAAYFIFKDTAVTNEAAPCQPLNLNAGHIAHDRGILLTAIVSP